jgi:hypothetical protein
MLSVGGREIRQRRILAPKIFSNKVLEELSPLSRKKLKIYTIQFVFLLPLD